MVFVGDIKMDCIILKNLEFYGRHGVSDEERKHPQKFVTTIKLYLDLKKAGQSDELDDTVNYSEVYAIVKGIFEEQSFRLIERIGEVLANILLERYGQLERVEVTVKKINISGKGNFDYCGVKIIRNLSSG